MLDVLRDLIVVCQPTETVGSNVPNLLHSSPVHQAEVLRVSIPLLWVAPLPPSVYWALFYLVDVAQVLLF